MDQYENIIKYYSKDETLEENKTATDFLSQNNVYELLRQCFVFE